MTDGSTSFRSFMDGSVALKRWRLLASLFVAYLGVNSAADLAHTSSARGVLAILVRNLPWALIMPILIFWLDWAIKCHRGEQIVYCVITFLVLCAISAAVSGPPMTLAPANGQRQTTNDHP